MLDNNNIRMNWKWYWKSGEFHNKHNSSSSVVFDDWNTDIFIQNSINENNNLTKCSSGKVIINGTLLSVLLLCFAIEIRTDGIAFLETFSFVIVSDVVVVVDASYNEIELQT